MSLLVPNVGEQEMLDAITGKAAADATLLLKLYKSNTTPGETDTAATYTVATFTGYSNVTLTNSSWNAATAGAPSYADYAQQTFTSSADQSTENIYGYYVVGGSDTILRWAERFSDAPNPITNNGDLIKITPKITLD